MESSKTPIESTTISIPPNSFPHFPISQTKSSKSKAAMEKWFTQPYEKTQLQQNHERSLEKISMEKEENRVADAPGAHIPRGNAPPVYVGSKVGKKRSRASSKAPTTVLSTDAWNFRAMVQHFTGFPQSSQTQLPTFHNNPPIPIPIPIPIAIPPPRYSSLLFHHDNFNPTPLFHPRAGSSANPLRQTAMSMDDVGLNQAALERGPGFGYFT